MREQPGPLESSQSSPCYGVPDHMDSQNFSGLPDIKMQQHIQKFRLIYFVYFKAIVFNQHAATDMAKVTKLETLP